MTKSGAGRPVEAESGLRYARVLIKLSGEALAGEKKVGFDFERVAFFCEQIKEVVDLGCRVGLVIGGGNIVRGAQLAQNGMDRVGADYMGMLGTVINALALQDQLEKRGVDTRVMTAIRMEELAEPYIRRRAMGTLPFPDRPVRGIATAYRTTRTDFMITAGSGVCARSPP